MNDQIIIDKVNRQRPGQCCTLIYTSGTTGNPKGVMLSHDNMIYDTQSSIIAAGEGGYQFAEEDRVVSYLPLSHIAALGFDLICQLHIGYCVYFARPDAL